MFSNVSVRLDVRSSRSSQGDGLTGSSAGEQGSLSGRRSICLAFHYRSFPTTCEITNTFNENR